MVSFDMMVEVLFVVVSTVAHWMRAMVDFPRFGMNGLVIMVTFPIVKHLLAHLALELELFAVITATMKMQSVPGIELLITQTYNKDEQNIN